VNNKVFHCFILDISLTVSIVLDIFGMIIQHLNSFDNFYLVYAAAAKSLKSCLIPCDPIDGSPPGSPIPGILQARTLEWVAISFSSA